jgi:hypothetical protein
MAATPLFERDAISRRRDKLLAGVSQPWTR